MARSRSIRVAVTAVSSLLALVAAIIPGPAAASGPAGPSPALAPGQIVVGTEWTLSARLILDGQVTVTCGPFVQDQFLAVSGGVAIAKAQGNEVAHAMGPLQPICDGVTRSYAVTAHVTDVPYRPGAAVAEASVGACGTDPGTLQVVCQTLDAFTQISIHQ